MSGSQPEASMEKFPRHLLSSDSLDIHAAFDTPMPSDQNTSLEDAMKDAPQLALPIALPTAVDPLMSFFMASMTRSPEDAVCPLIVVHRTVGRAATQTSTAVTVPTRAEVNDPTYSPLGGHPLAAPQASGARGRGADAGQSEEASATTVDAPPLPPVRAVSAHGAARHTASAAAAAEAGMGAQSAPTSPFHAPVPPSDGAAAAITSANPLAVQLLGYEDASSLVGRRFENMFCCYRMLSAKERASAAVTAAAAAATAAEATVSMTSLSRRLGASDSVMQSLGSRQPSVHFLTVPPPSLPETRSHSSHQNVNGAGPARGSGTRGGAAERPHLLVPPVVVSSQRVVWPARPSDDPSFTSISGLHGSFDVVSGNASAAAAAAATTGSSGGSLSALSGAGSPTLTLAEVHSVEDLFADTAPKSIIAFSLATGRYYSALTLCKKTELPAAGAGGGVLVRQELFLFFLSQVVSVLNSPSLDSLLLMPSEARGSDAPAPVNGMHTTPPSPSLAFASAAAVANASHREQVLSRASTSAGSVPLTNAAVSVPGRVHGSRRWWNHVRADERHPGSPLQPFGASRHHSDGASASSHWSRSPEEYPLVARSPIEAALDTAGAYARTTPIPFAMAANQSAALPEFSGPQSLASLPPAKSATSAMTRRAPTLLVPQSSTAVAATSITLAAMAASGGGGGGGGTGFTVNPAASAGATRALPSRALAVDEITTSSLRSKMMYMNGVRHVTIAEDVPTTFVTNFVLFAMLTQATLRKLRDMGFRDMCCFINVFKKAYLAIDFVLPSEIKFLKKKLGSTRAARDATLHSLQRAYRVTEARQVLHGAIIKQQQQQQMLQDSPQQPSSETMHGADADALALFDDVTTKSNAGELGATAPGLKPVVAARPVTDEEQQPVPLASFLTEDLIEQMVANDAEVRLSVGNGASIRFPFITKERLALLHTIPQVQLSSAKGLTMFGIAGANALTEQAAADADAPSPKIIPLQYDRAAEDFGRFQASLSTRHGAGVSSSTAASQAAGQAAHASSRTNSTTTTTASQSRISGSYGRPPSMLAHTVLKTSLNAKTASNMEDSSTVTPLLIEVGSPDAPHVASEYIRPSRVSPTSISSPHLRSSGLAVGEGGVKNEAVLHTPADGPAASTEPIVTSTATAEPAGLESPGDDEDFFSPSPQYASSVSSDGDDADDDAVGTDEVSDAISRVSSISGAGEEERRTPRGSQLKSRHTSGQFAAGAAEATDSKTHSAEKNTKPSGAGSAGTATVIVPGGLPACLPPLATAAATSDAAHTATPSSGTSASVSPGTAGAGLLADTPGLPQVLENTPLVLGRPASSPAIALLNSGSKRRLGNTSGGGGGGNSSLNVLSHHRVPSSDSTLVPITAKDLPQRPDTALPLSFVDDSKPLPSFTPVGGIAASSGEAGLESGLLSSLAYTATVTSIHSHDHITSGSASSIPMTRAMASTQADSDRFPLYGARDSSLTITPPLPPPPPPTAGSMSTNGTSSLMSPPRRPPAGRAIVSTTVMPSPLTGTALLVPHAKSNNNNTLTHNMSMLSNVDAALGTISSSKVIPLFGGFQLNNSTTDLLVRLSTAIPTEDTNGMTEGSCAPSSSPPLTQTRHDSPDVLSSPNGGSAAVQLPVALAVGDHGNHSTVAGGTTTALVTGSPTTATISGNATTMLDSSYSPALVSVNLPTVHPTSSSLPYMVAHPDHNKRTPVVVPPAGAGAAVRATATAMAVRKTTVSSGSGSRLMTASAASGLIAQGNDSFAADSQFDLFGSASRAAQGNGNESMQARSETPSSDASTSILRRRLHLVVYNTEERDEIDEALAQYGHSVLFMTKPAKMERFLRAGMKSFDVLVVEWCAALITPEIQQLLLTRTATETVLIIHVTVHPNGLYGDLPLPQSESITDESVVCSEDIITTVFDSIMLERTRMFIRQKRLLKDLLDVRLRHSYQIVRQIGSGAFGDVFEVVMYASRGRLAMKRIFLKNVKLSVLEQLNREVMIMSALDHPNIISFSHARLEENTYSIFMELGDGTLSQRLREPVETAAFARKQSSGSRVSSGSAVDPFASLGFQPGVVRHSLASGGGASAAAAATASSAGAAMGNAADGYPDAGALLSPREAILIIHDVTSGLAYLHHKDVIHRDIKPENVLFAAGVAKIADFGSATKVMEKQRLTNMRGTLSYMSPEVMLGERYSKPCDIWSLGCLIADIIGLNLGHLSGLHVPAMVELYRSLTEADCLPITLTNRVANTYMENHYADQVTQSVVAALKDAVALANSERAQNRRHTLFSGARSRPAGSESESAFPTSGSPSGPSARDKDTPGPLLAHQPSLAQFESTVPSEAASSQGSHQRSSQPTTTDNATPSQRRELLTLLPTSQVQTPAISTAEPLDNRAATSNPSISDSTTITNSCVSMHNNSGEWANASVAARWQKNDVPTTERPLSLTPVADVLDTAGLATSERHEHNSSHRGTQPRSRTVTCLRTNSVAVLGTHTAQLPASLVELFEGIFCRDPSRRMTIDDILNHPVTWDVEWMTMVRAELERVMTTWPNYGAEVGEDEHTDTNLLSLTFSSEIGEDEDEDDEADNKNESEDEATSRGAAGEEEAAHDSDEDAPAWGETGIEPLPRDAGGVSQRRPGVKSAGRQSLDLSLNSQPNTAEKN